MLACRPVGDPGEVEDRVLASLRRIVRANELHSRRLMERYGLTAPQLATLTEAARLGGAGTGELAKAVHLAQPTVSGILDRLERQELVRRRRSDRDRRSVIVTVTREGHRALGSSPSLLHERLRERIAKLEEWERLSILSALERIAAMMDAETPEADVPAARRPTQESASAQRGEAERSSAAGRPQYRSRPGRSAYPR